ncbi:phage tail protein [Salibacterium halotolerans]|uniref:Prophage minor tail protein Z (GPZ) n=1 Tax=Salibacterium halotolerans TaxID=1884432 RepID=A0A1I5MNB5_9BACI|nr:phage tail protein [Salibacterium halotolerans]SFP11059.1 Prophage minor tail protein Z (GPZ) [Salibacterium halotolerans]
MKMSVEVDEKLLEEVQSRLGAFQKKAPNAISNALNRASSNVRSNISKEIRKEYVIKAGDVKETLSKGKARRGDLSTEVRSQGSVIPLNRFKVSPKTVNPTRKKPIKIGVKKGSTKEVRGAFVADINGPKVFSRHGKSRLPISRLFGPSVPQMLDNEEIRQEINDQGVETFYERLDHEIFRLYEKGRG